MRIAIVGGGAAGMMCAASILESNPTAEIILIERNDGLGKKVIISGGGRCNVTTGIHDVKLLLKKYPRGEKFLTSAMYAFPPNAVYDWFEAHGVPLKTQADNRVFPQSDDGKDIVRVFDRLFESSKVQVMLKTAVTSIEKHGDHFVLHCKDAAVPIKVDRLVLTTGGQAYRQTGSTGDGYAFAQALGHSITSLAPSLNAFFTKETWPARISGLSFDDAKITAPEFRKSFTGPFLFTHKGVSGPAVFALSSLVAFEHYDAKQPMPITIDLFPDDPLESMTETLTSALAENRSKLLANVLALFVPKSLVEILLAALEISESKSANEVSKKDINRICAWLKTIPLSVTQRGAGDEFVTAGGVSLSEVDPITMQSKLCSGLYFAGEILDVDGFTGGFNLQASWAAGHLVGEKME
jgi:predicted Rossmann fold flavoprotein